MIEEFASGWGSKEIISKHSRWVVLLIRFAPPTRKELTSRGVPTTDENSTKDAPHAPATLRLRRVTQPPEVPWSCQRVLLKGSGKVRLVGKAQVQRYVCDLLAPR